MPNISSVQIQSISGKSGINFKWSMSSTNGLYWYKAGGKVKQILPMYAIHQTRYNGHSPVQLSRFIKTGLFGGSVNGLRDVDTKLK